jgi:glycolate oxidase
MMDLLEGTFGKGNVSDEETDCIAYSMDSSEIEGKTKAVVWPTEKEQIIELIDLALKNDWNVVPRGGGSGLAGGCVPQESIIIDMSKMNIVEKPDRDKKTVVVGPGLILDDLNAVLRDHELYFPINPTSHRVCSIGGMISNNAAGNRAIKYGKTSDWTEEIELIDGNGKLKVLSGQDLEDFVGSEGILGIIIRAKLMLTEPIKERSISLLEFTDLNELLKKVHEIKSNENVLSAELFDKITSDLSGIESKYHLFIEFEGKEGDIKEGPEFKKLWEIRESLGTVLFSNGYIFTEDPKIPIEKLPDFIRWLEKNKVPYFGHIALGIIHQRFNEEQKRKIPEMFQLVNNLGGNVSGEHGIGLRKKEYLGKSEIGKLKELKKKYDPNNILNRGKMI